MGGGIYDGVGSSLTFRRDAAEVSLVVAPHMIGSVRRYAKIVAGSVSSRGSVSDGCDQREGDGGKGPI